MAIPRSEYPRPQFVRKEWMNLNGEWDFEFDFGSTGLDRGMQIDKNAGAYTKKINVPFCPESKLSGIEYKDFMACVWYRKVIELPADWDIDKGHVHLHFDAVDFFSQVWINEQYTGCHRGGYVGFKFDITGYLKKGEANSIVLCARDDSRSGRQARGKQSSMYHSHGCDYTRTTGIWQTVWMEYLPATFIDSVKLTPDIYNKKLDINMVFGGEQDDIKDFTLCAEAFYEGRSVGKNIIRPSWRSGTMSVAIDELHLWEPLNPKLYDLVFTLEKEGTCVDRVESYFGMRNVELTKTAILINGKPVFQRLILDQGFYPEGIYTAPCDEELKADIQRSIDMGFNGARLHQKIFEPRFLYWADKLGYMCWGEHGNWGLDISKPENYMDFQSEWIESVERDYNHPSIVGWCPFNETQQNQDNRIIGNIYELTKTLDATRPVIDTSGWKHHISDKGGPGTDIFDVHDYDQNPESFKARYMKLTENREDPHITLSPKESYFTDMPYFVSEFGGTWWAQGLPGWGYGKNPENEEEFIERYKGLVSALLDNPQVCAFCYTQLTDIEQEVNGLYYYDRRPKFNPEILKAITSAPAAIEVR